MKKVILFSLALCLLAVPASAKKGKPAKAVVFVMEQQKELEKQPNEDINVRCAITHTPYMQFKGDWFPQPHIMITVQNHSERDIYVDLQKSFLIPNDETFSMFTNTTNVSTQGSTSISGVNLGLVGVGSANTNVNTKVTQEQRFIVIPADSKKVIDMPMATKWGVSWKLNNNLGEIMVNVPRSDQNNGYAVINQNFVHKGEVLTYNDSDNPFNLDIRINYSFNEDMNESLTHKLIYYTKYVIGTEVFYGDVENQERKLIPTIDTYTGLPNSMFFRLWMPMN